MKITIEALITPLNIISDAPCISGFDNLELKPIKKRKLWETSKDRTIRDSSWCELRMNTVDYLWSSNRRRGQ